jgi:hypothetical protein
MRLTESTYGCHFLKSYRYYRSSMLPFTSPRPSWRLPGGSGPAVAAR